MEKIRQSQFRIHSFAYAAHNLPLDKDILEVLPVEQAGFIEGELNNNREEFEDSGVDAQGNAYTVKVESSNVIAAKWLQLGSNRTTPPNIRRGERVLLWRVGDSDKYYWSSTGMDDYLRRYETVIFAVSNTQDESVKVLDPSNSYYVEFNTHSKQITVGTSKDKKGKIQEKFIYTVQINAKDSKVVITDDKKNFIELDSVERKITLHNTDGSKLGIEKENGFFNVPKTITGTCTTYDFKATDYNVNAENINYKASNFNIKSNININGNTDSHGKWVNNGKDVGSGHKHKNASGPYPSGPPV